MSIKVHSISKQHYFNKGTKSNKINKEKDSTEIMPGISRTKVIEWIRMEEEELGKLILNSNQNLDAQLLNYCRERELYSDDNSDDSNDNRDNKNQDVKPLKRSVIYKSNVKTGASSGVAMRTGLLVDKL
jgi:hypothetical protein